MGYIVIIISNRIIEVLLYSRIKQRPLNFMFRENQYFCIVLAQFDMTLIGDNKIVMAIE